MTRSTVRSLAVVFGTAIIVGASLAPLAARRGSPAAESVGSLSVTVRYQGKGTVDDTHRIWIWLFDTPNMTSGAIPLREGSIGANGRHVAFEGVSESRVWIAVAYDEQGGFAGNAPPPSGSPVGIYAADGTGPSPVVTAGDAVITVTFDDAVRMP